MLSRSPIVIRWSRSCFQTVGAKLKGIGDFVRALKAMKPPRSLYIFRWVGLVDAGFKMKHSRLRPCSLELLGDFINKGRPPPSSSSTMLINDSRNGPPASIEPSPRNFIMYALSSTATF